MYGTVCLIIFKLILLEPLQAFKDKVGHESWSCFQRILFIQYIAYVIRFQPQLVFIDNMYLYIALGNTTRWFHNVDELNFKIVELKQWPKFTALLKCATTNDWH